MEALLTTTAQCAATIIAIIGGFIVTKLISHSAESKEIEIRLCDITEEKGYRIKKVEEIRNTLIEDEALDLITDVISDFIDENISLEDAYNKERYDFTREEIQPFWDKANKAVKGLKNAINEQKSQLNDDNIPVDYAKTLTQFEYSVCNRSIQEVSYRAEVERINKSRTNRPFDYLSVDIPPMKPMHISSIWSVKQIEGEKRTHENHINLLELQEKQLLIRKASIKISHNLLTGLFVFLYFAVVSIVFPMTILAVLPIGNENTVLVLKIIIILLFVSGFTAIIIYLVSFMRVKKVKARQQNEI